MVTANLRKVGGSVMVAIPRAVLELVDMKADMEVSLVVENNQIVIGAKRKKKKRRYTLDELLAQCDFAKPAEDRSFLTASTLGREML